MNNFYLTIFFNILYKFDLMMPPSPHAFINKKLESNIEEVITEINELLPQLSNFIDKFNDFVIEKNVNVVTDATGNMSIDVPQSISDSEAQNISKRINIIDRLVTTQGQSVDALLQKGLSIEQELKKSNPNYSSQLSQQIEQFKKLNNSYKH